MVTNPIKLLQCLYEELNGLTRAIKTLEGSHIDVDRLKDRKNKVLLRIDELETEIYR